MKKNGIVIVSALFLLSTVFSGLALAKTICTVTSVEDTTVTMDCGDKADNFDAGSKVEVKQKKAKKALEGC